MIARTTIQIAKAILLSTICLLFAGCRSAVEFAGIQLFYREAPPAAKVLRDLPYRSESGDSKHRIDLFVPDGLNWPTLVFVHGGGWTDGDKNLVVAGADIYANIGRFYVERGYGVALINYRLQPEVNWREQVDDLGSAVNWLHRHLADYGGDPDSMFVSGHSAGAHMSTRMVVDKDLIGPAARSVCGVIPISGAAYDLRDERTWKLGADREYHEERLRAADPTNSWLTDASVVPLVDSGDPPFLLLYSEREWPALRHQNKLLAQAVNDAGGSARVIEIEGQSHARMVLAMTKPGTPVSIAILDFLRVTNCPRG